MIAKLTIENGRFVGGYTRKGEDKLDIKNSIVEWPQKWQVTLRPDAILATSFRVAGDGGNVVSFEVGLNGFSKLSLKTTSGERKLINMNQVFTSQNNLDGDLYLIYNGNGYRSAYFFSNEFLEWRKAHNIANVLRKDPNEIELKDKHATLNNFAMRVGELSMYTSGRLTTITDGNIMLENKKRTEKGNIIRRVHISDAKWAILEKARKNRIERVLITEQPVFELNIPEPKLERIKRCSKIGLELLPQAECLR